MINIDSDFIKNVGNRLSQLRKSEKLSINQLVDELSKLNLDINEKTIRRYEKGETLPKIDNLIYLANYFNVNLDYILYGKDLSDNDTFNWYESFKKINRLIYSLVLIPQRKEDISNNSVGDYYFAIVDQEVNNYLDMLFAVIKENNYKFEKKEMPLEIPLMLFDKIAEKYSKYPDDLHPTLDRFNHILELNGIDSKKYFKQQIERNTRSEYIKKKLNIKE